MRIQRILTIGLLFLVLTTARAVAQEHQHPQAPAAPADHQHVHGTSTSLFSPREGSGTSWLPASTEMYALHGRAGRW